MHELDGGVELVGIKVSTNWHGNEAWCTMVSEVEEHLGVLIRLEGGAVGVVTKKNVVEVLGGNGFARVVDVRLVVVVDALSASIGWVVEELSWEWVGAAVSNIVVSEMDDVLTGDAIVHHNLDGVMGVSLMTIVHIGVGTSHDDGPVGLSGSGKSGKSSGDSESLHCMFVETNLL